MNPSDKKRGFLGKKPAPQPRAAKDGRKGDKKASAEKKPFGKKTGPFTVEEMMLYDDVFDED